MRYISRNGVERWYKQPHEMKRSVGFDLLDRGHSWSVEQFLEIIWKHAGFLCKEVRLSSVYRDLEKKRTSHTYDLLFQAGPGLIDPRRVNDLVARIEEDCKKLLKIDMRGRGHMREPRLDSTKGEDFVERNGSVS